MMIIMLVAALVPLGVLARQGGRTRSHAPSFAWHNVVQGRSIVFIGEGCFALSMHPEEYPP